MSTLGLTLHPTWQGCHRVEITRGPQADGTEDILTETFTAAERRKYPGTERIQRWHYGLNYMPSKKIRLKS